MKLLTKELKKRFEETGIQDIPNPLVICKFFGGPATWYATAYYPNDNTCFGYVTGLGYDEWGYFSITEIEALRIPPLGLPVERDLHFKETLFSELNLKE